MRRLRGPEENVNTPEFFDEQWTAGEFGYDSRRLAWLAGLYGDLDHVEATASIPTDALTSSPVITDSDVRLLDLGAGICGVAEWLAVEWFPTFAPDSSSELYAWDFSPVAEALVARRAPSVSFCLGDLREGPPFEDGIFDIVVAGELIEHFDEPEEIFDLCGRLLAPSGVARFSTVDPNCESSQELDYPEHQIEFEPIDLLALGARIGTPRYVRVGNYDCLEVRT
jgi:SAM-dependent methyltransferase